MEFIELPSFTKRLADRVSDEDYRQLQLTLIENPEYGSLISGGGGLRKVRIKASGRGKSGGARVIYYWFVDDHQIFFLDVYSKNEKSDLTKRELRELVTILKELKQ